MPLGPIGALARQSNVHRLPTVGRPLPKPFADGDRFPDKDVKPYRKETCWEVVLRERLNKRTARFCTGNVSRIAMTVLLAWTATVDPIIAQTSQPADTGQQTPAQAPQTRVYSLTDLEYLLGPIALYPDPLLALILQASTFPLQIVQADRWLAANPNAVKKNDFTKVDSMPWDSSVQALTRFPDVIHMLADHLDWTQSLGMASSLQSDDVATTIQMLRAQAEKVGNLKSTSEQVVTSRDEGGSRIIYIAPANPERIYVPVYDSSTVFTDAVAGALLFGTGVLVGSAWNNRWGWNNRRWNQVWINPPVWHAPPPNWRPPGRPGARPPGVWRPDRPGTGRPDRPGVRPERPGTGRPERPGTGRPERPGVRPERPGTGRPERPAVRPERPATGRPERPAARPERPGTGQRPGNIERPQTSRPRPQARPQHRPGQGQGARTRQHARPQPGARPQHRARPQQGARPQQRARPQQGGPRSNQRGGGQQLARPQRGEPSQ
jgi:hypothetical protein